MNKKQKMMRRLCIALLIILLLTDAAGIGSYWSFRASVTEFHAVVSEVVINAEVPEQNVIRTIEYGDCILVQGILECVGEKEILALQPGETIYFYANKMFLEGVDEPFPFPIYSLRTDDMVIISLEEFMPRPTISIYKIVFILVFCCFDLRRILLEKSIVKSSDAGIYDS